MFMTGTWSFQVLKKVLTFMAKAIDTFCSPISRKGLVPFKGKEKISFFLSFLRVICFLPSTSTFFDQSS